MTFNHQYCSMINNRRISNIFLTKYCDCLWLSTRKTDTATCLLSIFVGKQDKENGNETAANNTNADENDSFTNEFLKNRIQITEMQRLILCAGSSIASLIDPRRHDMIACLGETTGVSALENNLEKMEISTEGQRILAERPRINSRAINLDALAELPESTFGYHYKKFLDDNKVTPDSRMEVRFLPNPKLAYIMTRYRECHDLIHTILGMPTNMLGEVSVKWVEAINIGLPMCYGGAVFGAIRLRPKQRADYVRYYLPWALHCGRNSKPLLSIYWEQRWEQDINELRSELNIKPFTKTASIT